MVVDFRSAPDPAAPRGPRWRLGVGAVVVLVLAVLAVTVAISATATRGGSGETAITSRPTSGDEPVGSSGSSGRPGAPAATGTAGSAVFVHVHGRVVLPGLYELAAGARVVDVVAAAGGFADDAEQGAVNLARPLVDGEQLYVPAVGEATADGADGGAGGAGGGSAAGSGGSGAGGALVDLNSADAAALESLPGVGPATSAAILDWRRENGAFRSVDDLLGVTGIGEKTLATLTPLVTV
jgi:competence protein ComEA